MNIGQQSVAIVAALHPVCINCSEAGELVKAPSRLSIKESIVLTPYIHVHIICICTYIYIYHV